MHARPDIAALIGSRICHDLISPIGAINNGLELLELAGSTAGPEMGLISDSVNNASARIRFFRLAFGAATDAPIPVQEVKGVLRDMTHGTRLSVIWDTDSDAPRTEIRLALLAEQCLESAMPFGGQITIAHDADGAWHVTGTAERMKLDMDLWSILTDGSIPCALAPTHVHFALLAIHSREGATPVSTTLTDTRIDIRF